MTPLTAAEPPTDVPTESQHGSTADETEVFAVYGVEPEVQAYAMAKYSRSALSMKESLREISSQKAEKFLNTFYFQYGHRSIADLAHIAMAIERLSILAAIILVDEQRWDGQERSTRYQNFRKSGYHTPDFGTHAEQYQLFCGTADFLFNEYDAISEELFQHLVGRTPQPPEMKRDQYERTLRARAFDASRYLLPLGTNTSLGQIVNARTLETQIARLLSSPYAEVRQLGVKLKVAANEPAYDLTGSGPGVRVAPTLVKYADANEYEIKSRAELTQAAAELMQRAVIEPAPVVDLLDESEPFETELATTLLYQHSMYRYRQVQARVRALSEVQRGEIINLGLRQRGKHDELSRAFAAGQKFRFDICMDLGAFRDMHRHRRCIQIVQPFAAGRLGYDTPSEMVEAGLQSRFDAAMQRVGEAQCKLSSHADLELHSHYLSPLAHRQRALFKMDFSEAAYIAELRTTPAGHYSYRRVAWQMYRALVERYPALAQFLRVTDINEPVDLLKR